MKPGAIRTALATAGVLLAATSALAQAPTNQSASLEPPPHTGPWPDLRSGQTEGIRDASLSLGPEMQRGRPAKAMLAERRRLDAALAALKPQRAGTVDAYVLSIALDSDPVFAREAREAGRVLARRFDAAGRSVVLAGADGRNADLPGGSITALTVTLARLAEVMDPGEDVLVLYSTSHGAPHGLAYHEGETGYGILAPQRLADVLAELGITRRIVILSACYSGVFVAPLANADSAILTAAAADRSSFGCQSHNDWTFFGDALVNRALRKRHGLAAAAREAQVTIAGWESARKLEASQPQVVIGTGVAHWLAVLDAKTPREETAPVGRPATGE